MQGTSSSSLSLSFAFPLPFFFPQIVLPFLGGKKMPQLVLGELGVLWNSCLRSFSGFLGFANCGRGAWLDGRWLCCGGCEWCSSVVLRLRFVALVF